MEEKQVHRLHAIVEGIVQGVGFRYFVVDRARELGLTGWVRNRWDGSVEVLAEGDRAKLEILLDALYQGPRSARVSEVRADWQVASPEYASFNIRMTVI